MENENTHFMDKVVSALRSAATEIEELQVQASLGKAEAADKYEEIKKKFDHFVHDAKAKFNDGKGKVDDLHTKFDELRVQLALGKAEGIEAFKEQKKKILTKIKEIEVKIKTNPTVNRVYAVLLIELEKFKVLLEWLEKKYGEGKDAASASFEKGKVEFNAFIDKVKERFDSPEESRWEHFQDEMAEAFSHMKQAFVKP
jgi:ElaB/YqjD/DUF883 family membrane-anchored ribosome-binding protein